MIRAFSYLDINCKSSLQINKQCITQLVQICLENSEHHMSSTTTVSLLIPDYKKMINSIYFSKLSYVQFKGVGLTRLY
ncbi:hypothetical protein VCR26J2_350714 [Vibrio coralliirubri]|nr:hypothetical protein VCR4J2_20153 [Vibrio coralliirubri]CDT72840.1 hypothetical protein VCR26J2_350714 [Vibrio coralliirubri]